eukprot:319533-Rhodomonas_salina.1
MRVSAVVPERSRRNYSPRSYIAPTAAINSSKRRHKRQQCRHKREQSKHYRRQSWRGAASAARGSPRPVAPCAASVPDTA